MAKDALGAHQAELRRHLDSLAKTAVGDLSDDDVRKLQLRLDALDKWASLNHAAAVSPGIDQDTNDHHVHTSQLG